MDESKKFDLEVRLIDFACLIIKIEEKLPETRAAKHLGGQLLRSGTSPALNYGEAKSAESKKDFIHKMKVCLKELRETFICMKIIEKSKIFNESEILSAALIETNELISIFVKSIKTAMSNGANN